MSATEPSPAATVPLEQFRERGWILKTRWRLVLACAALCGGWWAFASTLAPRHRMLAHSPGELARVHATWDDRCEACHHKLQRSPQLLQAFTGVSDCSLSRKAW